ATPADCGVANINYERKPPCSTEYVEHRYQLRGLAVPTTPNRQCLLSGGSGPIKQYGTGKRARTKNMRDEAQATTDSERIRQLEKENAKLREERDILRKAAKYFAEETRW
ncbi:transposase, partial [Corynebacterium aurimucosum]|uniref:transposase n=1 Tax=Corynebacterium aurimucosum TaxID=169292 RepID=UPI003F4FFA2A